MWPLKTFLYLFTFVGACALSFVYPIVGVVNYMFVYQINPNKSWWGIPLEPLGIRYAMTAAVCLIVGMVVSARRVPRSGVILGDWLILVMIFTGVVLVSGDMGVGQSGYTVSLLDKMVKMSIFLVCLVKMGAMRSYFKAILWTLVVGTLFLGYDAFTASRGDFFQGRLNFVGGVDFRESSGLAAHLAAMIPLIGVIVLASRTWRSKLIGLAAGALAVNTIIQCRTRSAFVGLTVGIVVAALMAPRSRRGRVYVALVVGCIGAVSLTDGYFWDRVNTIFKPDSQDGSSTAQTRLELWAIALEMFSDHPLGVGVGGFREEVADYNRGQEHAFQKANRVTHNTYLLCLTELGVQGIIVFATIIFFSLYKLRRCRLLSGQSADPVETRLLTFGCLISMVTYLSAAFFTDRLYTESFWWVLAFPVCLERAVVREVQAQEMVPDLLEEWSPWNEHNATTPWPTRGVASGSLG